MLDDIDERILSELSIDARQDISSLARTLRLGRDRVKYRLRKLEDSGVIVGYRTIINPAKLGISLYKTYFRLENHKERLGKLMNFVRKHPRTFWVAETYGNWDLIVAVFAHTPKEYQSMQDEVLTKFNDIILASHVYIIVDMRYFARGYLSDLTIDSYFVGEDDEVVGLGTLDQQILEAISDNCRLSYTEIAERTSSSPATVSAHLERLEKTGVIANYQVDLDLPKLGRSFFKAQIDIGKHHLRTEDEFIAYCSKHPSIVYFIKQIGGFVYEIEVEVKDLEHYNQLLTDIRERFRGFVRNIQTMVIRNQVLSGVPSHATSRLSKT